MAITRHIKECIKKKLTSFKNEEILFRYTKKIDLDNIWLKPLLNSKDKIFHITYQDQTGYMGIGSCREYIVESDKELMALKDINFQLESYGENTNKTFKIFGGIPFNLEQIPKDFWEDIPRGLFFIPKFLISKNKDDYFVSYHKFINKQSIAENINRNYITFMEELKRGTLSLEKTDLVFNKNIPSKEIYSNIFSIFSKFIADKTIDKVVLSRMKKFSINNKILLKDTSCTNFYIDLNENKRFLGATPELLIRIENKKFATSAIAGTLRKNSNSSDLDAFLNNKKELLEHQYVVDDLINKISNYSQEIKSSSAPEILELKYLYHLYTPIHGILKDAVHILDLVNHLHPTPAILGIPKDKALNIIVKHEPFDRGWYGGCIGWYDLNGEGRFDVAIRSALQTNKNLYCYAGGGIVQDSKENYEWEETELKFQQFLSAIK